MLGREWRSPRGLRRFFVCLIVSDALFDPARMRASSTTRYGSTGARLLSSEWALIAGNKKSKQLFGILHQGPGLLLLPNAWDAVTAGLIESLGAKAIATTSAGLAWSHGYPDGNALPEDQLIAAIREIARVIRVPLTVDIEAGYSDEPDAVARLVARVLAVGVVGINIEDGAGPPDLLCKKIAAIRDQVAHSGFDLFINARTDVYLRGVASGEAAIEEVISRYQIYRRWIRRKRVAFGV